MKKQKKSEWRLSDNMLFFWIILFIAAFLGCIALVFYLTIELNELEKVTGALTEEIRKRYGKNEKY